LSAFSWSSSMDCDDEEECCCWAKKSIFEL
jgi:hypothetical protein